MSMEQIEVIESGCTSGIVTADEGQTNQCICRTQRCPG